MWMRINRWPATVEFNFAGFDRFNGRTSAAYGWALANRGRWDEALEQLSKALDTWDMAAVHYNLGVVNEQLGRTDEAARGFRAALHRDPGMADTIVDIDET